MEDSKRLHKFHGKPGEDFYLWCARTEAALGSKEVLHVVVTDVVGESVEGLSDELKLSIAQARAIIIQGLGDKPLRLCLSDKDNPFKMWERLRDRYAVSNVVTRVQLQTRLSRLAYSDQAMSDFIDEFEECFNRLSAMECAVSEQLQVAMLLASFGDKSKSAYGQVVASMQMMEIELSWESATARLLQEYEEKLWASKVTSGQSGKSNHGMTIALAAKETESYRHTQSRHPKGRTGSGWQERRRCYECHEVGHLARDCPNRREGDSGQGKGSANHATMLMAVGPDVPCCHLNRCEVCTFSTENIAAPCSIVSDEHKTEVEKSTHRLDLLASTTQKGRADSLLLDSGASEHMVRNRNWLSDVHSIAPREIVLGNGAVVLAHHQGILTLRPHASGSSVRSSVSLGRVLLVPGLKTNLVSCSALCSEGFTVAFGKDVCSVLESGSTVLEGETQRGIYAIRAEVVQPTSSSAMAAQTKGEELWHNRLGHANVESIRELSKKRVVSGLDLTCPRLKQGHCEDCLKGKHHKTSMHMNPVRAASVGAVVHSDVCGPMSVTSFGGSRYYVTFIDEFSGFITVVPIARKSDVASAFKKYHPWLERKYDCKLKRLHCDGGGEYRALAGYLESEGIELQQTPPYSPEQNGIAERANRTLMESARSMILHAKMPRAFWAEAVVHAADIRNRFLCPRNEAKTSYELMTGIVPRMDHLKVFGSLAFTLVPKELRKKLDNKSVQGVVVGCFENSQFKVWIPSTKAAVLARHVNVLENTFPPRDWYNLRDSEFGGTIIDRDEDNQTSDSTPQATTPQSLPPREVFRYATPTTHNSPDFGTELDMLTYVPGDTLQQQETDDVITAHGEEVTDSDRATHDVDMPEESDQSSGRGERYPQRERKQVRFFDPSAANVAVSRGEPDSLREAMESKDAALWDEAIQSELSSLRLHGTWTVVKRPEGVIPLQSRFVFKKKMLDDGTVGRYKARLVVKGYMQGNVDHTFAPVVDFSTVRTALCVAVQQKYHIDQMDVRTAFLHGEINEEVYILPPAGSPVNLQPDETLKLQKGLYGLKQAPRLWNEKWETVMKELGFSPLLSDPCVYRRGNQLLWVLLYVDDVIVIGKSREEVDKFKRSISQKLDMKDLGFLSSFLGISFTREPSGAWLSQAHYVDEILERFGMEKCKSVNTPACIPGKVSEELSELVNQKSYQEIVGALLFLSTRTRPDISAAVNILCRHCSRPRKEDLVAAKRIMRYLQGTRKFALYFSLGDGNLIAYSDADWGGDTADRKSTSGTLLQLAGSSILWKSSKQKSVALSTTEAEYLAISEVCKNVIWIRAMLQDFDVDMSQATPIHEDNQGAIAWTTDGVRHAKHVSIRMNFVKEQFEQGHVKIVYCPTDQMVADILTKPLLRVKFEEHRERLGVLPERVTPESKRGY